LSQLFARVELRGSPGEDVYERLHEYMESLYWYRTIAGSTGRVTLPHATYQATVSAATPDLMAMGNTLKSGIESTIWTKALVLVLQATNWARTNG
jgi:hypothetical protein